MTTDTDLEPEWSHIFNVDDLENKPLTLEIAPDQAHYDRLVRRLGVLSLKDVQAKLKIKRIAGSASIHIKGDLSACVTQECVISAEPVESVVNETFEAWYGDNDAAISLTKKRQEKLLEKGHTEIPLVEEQDDPEPIINGAIDVGELVTQYLSLGITPYPRAEGASHESMEQQSDDEFSFKNPFAGLKDWKEKLVNKE